MNNFEVRQFQDTFTVYELQEHSTSSRILVCPERGGIVIGCQLHGEELFYLDKSTFENPASNIRGGNPILFPIAGSLKDGTYVWNDKTYKMGQHGVARLASWEVVGTSTENEASITLRLRANEETMNVYPFNFELVFTYALVDGELHTRQQYRNLGETESMPFYSGFHPYFAIDSSKNIAYESDATSYLDFNDNVVKPYLGYIDMEPLVESVCLLGAKKSEISFPVRKDVRIRLRYDDLFKYMVIWTVKDRPFMCVEPWMGLPDELNNKQELVMVEPDGEVNANFIISCQK
ncbi:aldose epimerase [Paenibacillus sp. GSMTC-2017]|uniref:aldose epimerase family protein n=1 Tax=Paenibacillus sp. GSMTC-2017 TaxID=2794350 RepID=UPI0018D9C675|nr:aldose epimerase [Paenibacillus sp. GSMTC-2017]MBH5318667.1 aldose epimerase [Paenibacillus sp. GSMTC-2017]